LDFGIAKITEPTGTYDPGLTAFADPVALAVPRC